MWRRAASFTIFSAPAPRGVWGSENLYRRERGLQIVDEIIDLFHTDREPDKRIGDSKRRPHLRRDRAMRHDGGIINQALEPAQALCERKEMGVLEKTPGAGQIGLQYDRDHSAEGAHLFFGQVVLRMLL
jgi:hypothetical protein